MADGALGDVASINMLVVTSPPEYARLAPLSESKSRMDWYHPWHPVFNLGQGRLWLVLVYGSVAGAWVLRYVWRSIPGCWFDRSGCTEKWFVGDVSLLQTLPFALGASVSADIYIPQTTISHIFLQFY